MSTLPHWFLLALLALAACSDLREDAALPSGPAAKVHPEGWLDPASTESFHGQAIRQSGWDMSGCQSCHGQDYAGGIAQSSCLECHSRTPEGCAVCHGGSGSIAPPEDLEGRTETRFAGVGAHRAHLEQGIAPSLSCGDCHLMPESFADPAHIDGDGRAEVVLGERARLGGRAPTYDPETFACANTYCHSGGRFGDNPVVVWNEVGSGQADCGTCHGLPPLPTGATGHPGVPESLSCNTCHSSVVDQDLNIIDSELHINGRVDL